MTEPTKPAPGDQPAMVHGVPVTERQSRAVLMMLRDRLAGSLPGYMAICGDKQGKGWDDCVRLVEKCIDQHTESIGDRRERVERGGRS